MISPVIAVDPLGDAALTVTIGSDGHPVPLAEIHAAARAIREAGIANLDDVVVGYTTLAAYYDPLRATYAEMSGRVTDALRQKNSAPPFSDAVSHEIAVRYDGADLENVANSCDLSVDEVVQIHTGGRYVVDLLGFAPGFAYLSGLSERLRLPRRGAPRTRVPAGSVAIAGLQTAVYPLATPGGWHLLGKTDTRLFDHERDPPALLQPGDSVRFVSLP